MPILLVTDRGHLFSERHCQEGHTQLLNPCGNSYKDINKHRQADRQTKKLWKRVGEGHHQGKGGGNRVMYVREDKACGSELLEH